MNKGPKIKSARSTVEKKSQAHTKTAKSYKHKNGNFAGKNIDVTPTNVSPLKQIGSAKNVSRSFIILNSSTRPTNEKIENKYESSLKNNGLSCKNSEHRNLKSNMNNWYNK